MKTTKLVRGNFRSYKVLYLILLMGLVSSLHSQDFNWKNLTRGKVWVSLWNTTGVGLTTGGGEPYRYDYPGYKKGADVYSSYGHVEWAGYMAWADTAEGVGVPFRVFNAYDPNTALVVALENTKLIKNYNLVDPTIPAEEIVTGANRMVKYGIDMYFRAMAWSYPAYDDFIIFEYTLVNTGGKNITNFRFAPTAELCISTGSWIGWWRDDDYYEWDLDHEAYYFHDGRTWDAEQGSYVDYDYGLTKSDKGDPADLGAPTATTHEFRSPGYFTYYWLDKPEKSDPTEKDHMNIVDKNNILQQWTRPQTDPMNDDPEIGVDTDEYFLQSMMYDQPPPLTTEDGTSLVGILTDPAPRERGDFEYMIDYIYSTGPYDIAPGDSLKFVMVVAAGMMDYQRVMEGGLENEAHLIDGADSLWAHVDAAQRLYDRGYKLPHPPPTPNYGTKQGPNSLLLTPVPGGVQIQWDPIPDTYVDPDYGVNDVAGYKVYQATFRSVGPWTLVKTIPIDSVDAYLENGLVTYTVTGELGVGYYYGVTSFDTGHNSPWPYDASVSSLPALESGLVNGNHEPVYPLAAPSNDLDEIRVYPNPFKQTSGLTGSGEEYRMEFVNIPAMCTIRIYTLAGDLVIKLEHTDESGDEAWGSRALADYQVNQYMQYVAPGIYLFHVESHVPGHEGESKIGKFVIIK